MTLVAQSVVGFLPAETVSLVLSIKNSTKLYEVCEVGCKSEVSFPPDFAA